MRLFVAIELPDSLRMSVSKAAFLLRDSVEPREKIQWVRQESLHITLKFLGSCDAGQTDLLIDPLAGVARGALPFTLSLNRAGCFPDRGTPSVVWIGLEEGMAECRALAARVEAICAGLGFPQEDRPYHPHVTLARVKWTPNGRDLRNRLTTLVVPRLEPVAIQSISLMESRTEASGAVYFALHRFPFTAA